MFAHVFGVSNSFCIDQLDVQHQLSYLHFPLHSLVETECLNYVVSTAFLFVEGTCRFPLRMFTFRVRKVM